MQDSISFEEFLKSTTVFQELSSSEQERILNRCKNFSDNICFSYLPSDSDFYADLLMNTGFTKIIAKAAEKDEFEYPKGKIWICDYPKDEENVHKLREAGFQVDDDALAVIIMYNEGHMFVNVFH